MDVNCCQNCRRPLLLLHGSSLPAFCSSSLGLEDKSSHCSLYKGLLSCYSITIRLSGLFWSVSFVYLFSLVLHYSYDFSISKQFCLHNCVNLQIAVYKCLYVCFYLCLDEVRMWGKKSMCVVLLIKHSLLKALCFLLKVWLNVFCLYFDYLDSEFC